ncbi:hypothetical protein QQZ08_010928 [Neonectria magnoliae]|uniref:LysM domain-containing protein n=1 Tax=Neonectria magnoliae TaxID=2732573 RepID=A0ABR1HDQ4_9HYPO
MMNLNSFLILGFIVAASTASPAQTIASVALPTEPAKLEDRQCNIVRHTVTAGEFLSRIAANAGVGVCNIATRNALTNINSIDVGDVLTFAAAGCEPIVTGTQCCIPAVSATARAAVAGDRYWNFHVTRGIDVRAIVSANPGVPSNAIPVGRIITLPSRPRMNC